MTDDIRTRPRVAPAAHGHARPLDLDAVDVPQRAQRMEPDTAAALAAAVVGVVCLLTCAVALITEYVAPHGALAVVLASVAAGTIATALSAGGVWAWLADRRGGRD